MCQSIEQILWFLQAEQSPAVHARKIAINQARRFVMAGSAVLDLVDRGHGGLMLGEQVNSMRVAVALGALCFAVVDAAADRAQRPSVTVAAALLVSQGFEIGILVVGRNVRMAIGTGLLGVRGGRENDVLVASLAVRFLCV